MSFYSSRRRRAWADMGSDDGASDKGWDAEQACNAARLSPMRSRTPSPLNSTYPFVYYKTGNSAMHNYGYNNNSNNHLLPHDPSLMHQALYNNYYYSNQQHATNNQQQHQHQLQQQQLQQHQQSASTLSNNPQQHIHGGGTVCMAGECTPGNSDAQTVDSTSAALTPQMHWNAESSIASPFTQSPTQKSSGDISSPHGNEHTVHCPQRCAGMPTRNNMSHPIHTSVAASAATPGSAPYDTPYEAANIAKIDPLLASYQEMLNCEMMKLRSAFAHYVYNETTQTAQNNVDMQAHVAALEAAEIQFKTREAELESEVTELKENAKQMSALKEKVQEKAQEVVEERKLKEKAVQEQAKKDETIASLKTRLEELEAEIVGFKKLQKTTESDLQSKSESLKNTEQELQKSHVAFEKRKTALKELQSSFTREWDQNRREIERLKAAHLASLQSLEHQCEAKKKESEQEAMERIEEYMKEAEEHKKCMLELKEAHEHEVRRIRLEAQAMIEAEKAELLETGQGLQLQLKQTMKDNNTKVRRLEDKLSAAYAKVSNVERARSSTKKVSSAEVGIQHNDDYLNQKFLDKIRAGKEELRIAEERIKKMTENERHMEEDAKTMSENLDAFSIDLGIQERKISEMQRETKDLSNNKKEAEKLAESYHQQNKFLLEENNRMQQKMIEQRKSVEYMKWNYKLLKEGTQAQGVKQNVFISPKSSLSCFPPKQSDACPSTACPTELNTEGEMTT